MGRASTAFVAAALAAGPLAASPILSYRAEGLEGYLSAIADAESRLGALCETLGARAPAAGRLWLRVGPGGLEIAPEDDAAREATAFWTEMALGAREAARALYGADAGARLANGPVLIEMSEDAVSVFDGAARGQGDFCAAMARVAGAMGGGAAAPFAAARAAAAPEAAAPVPVGGETVVTLASPPPADAVLRAPPGVIATAAGDAPGAVRLVAGAGATPGPATLRVYDRADPFRPVGEAPLVILPGQAPAADAGTGAVAPGRPFSGAVPVGGEIALSVTMERAGRLAFTSSDDTDLSAVLETADGRPVARDDDSGAGYGFRLGAELPAGSYVLRVRHCCLGGGPVTVSAATE